jgi:hypothetical protein
MSAQNMIAVRMMTEERTLHEARVSHGRAGRAGRHRAGGRAGRQWRGGGGLGFPHVAARLLVGACAPPASAEDADTALTPR